MKGTSGSGGLSNAGGPDSGGAPAAGEGGASNEPGGDGFACERHTCVPGEVCVNCDFFGDAFPLICAPDPELDQAGYDARVEEAGCLAVYPQRECDGPEDCTSGEYCVYGAKPGQFGAACTTESELPDPVTQFCCFTCDAFPKCTLCWTDEDCPEAQLCAPVDASGGLGGCRVAD